MNGLRRWARLALGMPSFVRTGQFGDGRETACADFVEATAPRGDVAAALAAIDTFATREAMLVKVLSVEFSAANAEVARRIWAHAGVAGRVTCVVGTIGDGGHTLDTLAGEHDVTAGGVDLLFIDHDKSAYLPDLLAIEERGWLHRGSIVVADNVRIPGAPGYRRYMREQQGVRWDTVEHKTHVEYQSLLPDLVLESEYLVG
ncbi:O-methyltransferase [Mycolicibacterium parafortuitum]|uniref:Putative catechol-O-methyltransferase [Mycobacterium tuberculosis H37Rv] n=1 Tax=Mycolicibacterium parafortuitum TaxID=39692 RepID=A0A375YN67_MYCPF|nr:class I SAM-dependent methyltransferase [Mycolicibacterium parafortuitum]ORB28640.1 SAM-dependent methyltransferase [Mycolicibacterium parafortuitum]SRX82521.1 putative catechol-O-methyltransferase [Mycobacterium tuberculosis H37Rv] [Mycolicibacterium parafortuitum]